MRRFAWVIVLAVVGCDQGTKELARRNLRDEPVEVVAGVFDLHYTENPGVAFRLDRVVPEPLRRPLVLMVPLAVAAAVAWAFVRRRQERAAETWAWALVLGGAAGNLLDRVLFGHVVDFLYLHGWPIFNVADVAIGAGAILLLLTSRRRTGAATSSRDRGSTR